MGCCGSNRPVPMRVSLSNTKTGTHMSAIVVQPRKLSGRQVGDNCMYCGTKIEVKAKKTRREWKNVPWCSHCKLEV